MFNAMSVQLCGWNENVHLIAIFSSKGVNFQVQVVNIYVKNLHIILRRKAAMKRFVTLILAILLREIYFTSGLSANVDSLQETLIKNESEEAGMDSLDCLNAICKD